MRDAAAAVQPRRRPEYLLHPFGHAQPPHRRGSVPDGLRHERRHHRDERRITVRHDLDEGGRLESLHDRLGVEEQDLRHLRVAEQRDRLQCLPFGLAEARQLFGHGMKQGRIPKR